MSIVNQKGLSIKRDGASNSFVISWKIGEKKGYDDQKLEWWCVYLKTTDDASKKKRYHGTTHKVALTKRATSHRIYVDFSNFPPTGVKRLCYIEARVKAKKDKSWSKWTKVASFDVQRPKNLTKISAPAPISNAPNTAVYSWNINDTGGKKIYYRCHYQVVERPGEVVTSLDKVKKSAWSKALLERKSYNGNQVSIPVSAMPVGTNTITQCFRVRAYGPQGFSRWIYSWHVFGVAPKAKNVKVTTKESPNGYIVTVTWETYSKKYNNPADGTVVEYIYIEPIVDKEVDSETGTVTYTLSCPDTSQGWTSKAATVDTKSIDRLTFSIDGRPQANQCMFVRVNNLHDLEETTRFGEIVLVNTDGTTCGFLDQPVIRNVDYNDGTGRVTVELDNTSGITNSYTALYFAKNDEDPSIIGIIPYGDSSGTFVVPEMLPNDKYKFGLKTYVADYTDLGENSDGSMSYSIDTVYMASNMEWRGGTISGSPEVKLSSPESGCILVEWDWPWRDAQSAELSWSQNPNSWESTDDPSVYTINNNRAAKWRIYGLDYGRWFVRVRLIQRGENYENYGLYSETKSIDIMAGAPPTPLLTVEPSIVAEDDEVSFYWAYEAEDGSTQVQADIVEVTEEDGHLVYGEPIRSSGTSQHLTVNVGEVLGWHSGETHQVALRTVSSFNTVSNYSDIVTVQVADPLVVSAVLGQGFSSYIQDEQTYYELNSFPFTVTVTGAGDDGTTGLAIQRAYQYPLERPDETDIMGYEGETVVIIQNVATGDITVDANDPTVLGSLDDTEEYILTVNATDAYGQRGEYPIRFRVNWDHKASVPSANIEMDYNRMAAIITPFTNFELNDEDLEVSIDGDNGMSEGDVCDIYRLSSDKPELVFAGAEFGQTYVDPYPAIGQFGGYRIVYRTRYNDFITDAGMLGWTDYGYEDRAALRIFTSIIDFDDDQVILPYNLELNHKWEKDFIETKYLGGSIQGDWNPAVGHTLSMHTDVAVEYDSETFLAMRRLARYAGVCHIRTPDGSSFTANIEVSEDREEKMITQLARFSLEITRVDQEGENGDGLTWDDWNDMYDTGE